MFSKKLTKPKDKVGIFFFSAPFEEPNTGDYDYITSLLKGFDANQTLAAEVQAIYLTGNAIITQGQILKHNQSAKLYDVQESIEGGVFNNLAILNKKRNNKESFFTALDIVKKDTQRQKNIENIIGTILEFSKQYGLKPVFNLQLRAPETGFLIMAEDIRAFQGAGIRVNVTCHEYKLNYTRTHLQDVLHPYFVQADHVVFFNEHDRQNAIKRITNFDLASKSSLSVKSTLSAVPPTIDLNFDIGKTLDKPHSIIVFGLIREGKGFEFAIDIATEIKERQVELEKLLKKPMRVIIAGKPVSENLMEVLLRAKYGKDIDLGGKEITSKIEHFKAWHLKMQKVLKEELPLDLYFDVPPQEMQKLFDQARYAVKFDEKGWARNASGHIAAIANGCILYTGWGMDTPDEVLPARTITKADGKTTKEMLAGKYQGAVVFLSGKYGLKYEIDKGITGKLIVPKTAHLISKKEKEAGRRSGSTLSSSLMKNAKFAPVTATMIIDDIVQRIKNPKLDEAALHTMGLMLKEVFNPKVIAHGLYLSLASPKLSSSPLLSFLNEEQVDSGKYSAAKDCLDKLAKTTSPDIIYLAETEVVKKITERFPQSFKTFKDKFIPDLMEKMTTKILKNQEMEKYSNDSLANPETYRSPPPLN